MGKVSLNGPETRSWQDLLAAAAKVYSNNLGACLDAGHFKDTPERLVKTWTYNMSGCQEDPAALLEKRFAKGKYDEMIHVSSIKIVTLCAHHFERIVGKAHFAYVPGKYIVGLSKIPRMIDVLCRRPQVQEHLTEQIVDTFQRCVKPGGCAVHIRAFHFCMSARGVKEPSAYTKTTALRGCFKTNASTRNEFFQSIDDHEVIFP
jgi:GTP cyclohydrolase IA